MIKGGNYVENRSCRYSIQRIFHMFFGDKISFYGNLSRLICAGYVLVNAVLKETYEEVLRAQPYDNEAFKNLEGAFVLRSVMEFGVLSNFVSQRAFIQ